MRTVIVCFLCLFLRQVISEDLPPLENVSEVEEDETGIYSVFSDSPSCAIESGVLGCSSDCKSIRFCLNQKEILIDCSKQAGLPYCDPKADKSECTAAAVECPVKPIFVCPPGKTGRFPYALNCSRLWECSETTRTLKACGPGNVFDPLNKNCSKDVPCYTFSYVNGLCKGKEGLFVTHPLNRGIYAHCDGPFPEIYECDFGLSFNTNKLTCEFECKSTGIFKDPLAPEKCYYTCTKNSSAGFQMKYDCCDDGFDENLAGCNDTIPILK